MMEFLDKIYGYEHFGIILFSVIVALVLIFLIVLFFGKKDEKKREIEKTQKLEQEKLTNAFAETTTEAIPVEVPKTEPVMAQAVETPVMEHIVQEMPTTEEVAPVMPVVEPIISVVEAAPVLEPIVEPSIFAAPVEVAHAPAEPEIKEAAPTSFEMPEAVLEPIKEETTYDEIEIPNFNFDELAASIASELSELDNKEEVSVSVKEEPVINPIVTETPITRMDDIVRPTPRPVQTFSSVYVNKPAEPVINEVVVEPIEQKPVAPVDVPVKPVQNPNIELPKPAEMPILKQTVTQDPTPVSNPNPTVLDFSQFEGESYNLK